MKLVELNLCGSKLDDADTSCHRRLCPLWSTVSLNIDGLGEAIIVIRNVRQDETMGLVPNLEFKEN